MSDWDDAEVTQQMMEELEEKEEQLRLAAEFGQTLLERTEELQEENEAMEREKEALASAFQEHEYRLQELADNSERLAEEAAAKDAELEAVRVALAQQQKEMEDRIAAASGSSEEKERAAAEAQAALTKHQEEAAAEMARLQAQAEEIERKEKETQLARENEERERIEAQQQKKAMEDKLRAAEEEMQKQKQQMADAHKRMEAETKAAAVAAADAEQKKLDMIEMQNKLKEMERELEMARSQPSASQGPSFENTEAELGGMSLFDELSDSAAAGVSEGVPPSDGPDVEAIKSKAEKEAREAANAEIEKEKQKLRAQFQTRLMQQQEEADAKAAAEAAKTGTDPVATPVDEEKLRAEMEAKYKQEQQKAKATAEAQFRAKMEAEVEATRKKIEEDMAAQVLAAQKAKEYEMRTKSLCKALGVSGKVDQQAMAAMKKINVECIQAVDALKEARSKVVDEESLNAAKSDITATADKSTKVMKKASGKGQRRASYQVDAQTVTKTGAALAGSVLDNLAKLSEGERSEMMSHVNTLKANAQGAVEDDESLSGQLADAKAGALKAQGVAALATEAQAIASSVKSKDDIMRAFQENQEFVRSVKSVVCEHLKNAVTQATIPTIDAEKTWGRYQISDLAIASLELEPDMLDLQVDRSVAVKAAGLNVNFREFKWDLDRKSGIPKIKDNGTGTAEMRGVSITVVFDIVVEEGTEELGVLPKTPDIVVDKIDVQVKNCKYEWIFNKMLKWFENSVKDKTVAEIQLQADQKVEDFGERISDLMRTVV